MIDNTCGFEQMAFMDGFFGCNQIKMHPEDKKHIISDSIWRVLLHYHAIWSEKCWCHISEGYDEEVMDKIEQEVKKLKSVGFIREEQHPVWLANIVPVTKQI